jgi:hypothetical protein
VLPGRHTVRVLNDGYEPAEAFVEVTAAGSRTVDLKLSPMTSSGRLRVIDDAAATGIEVVVDGAPVGTTPWEGNLGRGRHLVALRGDAAGSAPTEVNVSVGQTLEIKLRSEPLGEQIRIEPSPDSAFLSLGDTKLGRGAWAGRLPARAFVARAAEEGYFTGETAIPAGAHGTIVVPLRVDPSHPRWPKAPTGTFRIEAFAGLAYASSLHGDAESLCPGGCADHGHPFGWTAGLRASYALVGGLRIEGSGGPLRLAASVHRTVSKEGRTFDVTDDLTLGGNFVAIGLGYGAHLTDRLDLVTRVALGAAFLQSRDDIAVTEVSGAQRAPLTVDHGGASARDTTPIALPEIGVEYALGSVFLSGSLTELFLLQSGSVLPHGEAATMPIPSTCAAGNLACERGTTAFVGEQVFKPSGIPLLRLGAGWKF